MKLGLNRLVCIVCGTIACIGVVFLFLTPLKTELLNATKALTLKQAYFSKEGTIIPVICFILLPIGGLCTVMFGLNKNKAVGFVGMGILLLSAILLFCTESIYLTSKAINNGIPFGDISKYVDASKNMMSLGLGPILGGVCGLIGGLATPVVLFVFEED